MYNYTPVYVVINHAMVCPFQLFLENLEHEDSFVYLSAIQGNEMVQPGHLWRYN